MQKKRKNRIDDRTVENTILSRIAQFFFFLASVASLLLLRLIPSIVARFVPIFACCSTSAEN